MAENERKYDLKCFASEKEIDALNRKLEGVIFAVFCCQDVECAQTSAQIGNNNRTTARDVLLH